MKTSGVSSPSPCQSLVCCIYPPPLTKPHEMLFSHLHHGLATYRFRAGNYFNSHLPRCLHRLVWMEGGGRPMTLTQAPANPLIKAGVI